MPKQFEPSLAPAPECQVWTAMKSVILSYAAGYKRYISPWLPRSCRFEPTCSEYMYQAVERRGVSNGNSSGVKRCSGAILSVAAVLIRCHKTCLVELWKKKP